MEAGTIVRVIKDFLTTNEGELCVSVGEILQVISVGDKFWTECRLDARQGLVPGASIAPVSLCPLRAGQRICVARSGYIGQKPGDLNIKKGDLLVTQSPDGAPDMVTGLVRGSVMIQARSGAWCEGSLGMFPISLCWQPDPHMYSVAGAQESRMGRAVEKFAQVKQSLTAQLEDELELKVGQIVKITNIIDKDWYRGECGGRSGIFPASFVRVVDAFPGDTPGPGADSSSYLRAELSSGHEYDNTRPMFGGLDSELRAAFGGSSEPSVPSYPITSSGARLGSQLGPDYTAMASSLGAMVTNQALQQSAQADQDLGKYNNMQKYMTSALCQQSDTEQGLSDMDLLALDSGSGHRYQNGGFEGQAVDVRPYAVALYDFVPQFENELGFRKGDMVFLLQHVDHDWLEGEMDGEKGILPSSYVSIVVDCVINTKPELGELEMLLRDSFYLAAGSEYRVAFTFTGEREGDLGVTQGEVVTVVSHRDQHWCTVTNTRGDTGLCPVNHLNTCPESVTTPASGDQALELELLESRISAPRNSAGSLDESGGLKFFDPLRSPDEEMMRLEVELVRRAVDGQHQAANIPINPELTLHKNIDLGPGPGEMQRTRQRFKSSPSHPTNTATVRSGRKPNIDSFITQNLDGLKDIKTKNPTWSANSVPSNFLNQLASSTVPPASHGKGFKISDSVREELRDKQRRALSAAPATPPRPNETHNGNINSKYEEDSLYLPMSDIQKPPPQKPPPPAPTKKFLRSMESSTTLCSNDSIYATVDKNKKRSASRSSSSGENYYQSVDISSGSQVKHFRGPQEVTADRSESRPSDDEPLTSAATPPPPPLPPFRSQTQNKKNSGGGEEAGDSEVPRPTQSYSESDECCVIYQELPGLDNVKQTVTAEINITSSNAPQLASPDDVYGGCQGRQEAEGDSDQGPNADTGLCQVPTPKRTSSIVKRLQSAISGRAAVFPPDKEEAIISCGDHDQGASRQTVASSSGSEDGRSSLATPSMSVSCLHHSYETLNMSDPGLGVLSQPHRPAPKPPQAHSDDPELSKADRDEKSVERKEKDRKTIRRKKISSLKRQISIREKQLEEQLLLELDMYQDIAVARGPTYDTLNARMDKCQQNIETMGDDIVRLQGNLAEEEMKLEEDKIDELTRREDWERARAEIRARRAEEERVAAEERRRRNAEQRDNILRELLTTEREYCRDLKLLFQAFNLDCPDQLEEKGIDVKYLFGNLSDVISVSEQFLASLQPDGDSGMPGVVKVAASFLKHAEAMKSVFNLYCLNHDKAETLLTKYESQLGTQKPLNQGLERIRIDIACFNLESILIKPVQRILKYPLILNELLKSTDDDHCDKAGLREAVTVMGDIAAFINETKRRKDIVEKYKTGEDSSLSRKISKFNMHSIGKKSSRMGQKLLTSLGMDAADKDAQYDLLYKQFSHLTLAVGEFSTNAARVKEQLHELVVSQFNLAQNISDFYKEKRLQLREVERFKLSYQRVISSYWNTFSIAVEERVLKPLSNLQDLFQGPVRLCQKRTDKLMDYTAAMQKLKQNKDANKKAAYEEELAQSRTTYEALNCQLVDEMPTLLELATGILGECVTQLVTARKLYVGSCTRELLAIMEIYKRRLPLLCRTAGDIVEVFLIKHSLVATHYARFSFASPNFKPEVDPLETEEYPTKIGPEARNTVQSCGDRKLLAGKYVSSKLYTASRDSGSGKSHGAGADFDLRLRAGDMVGVIQQKDPSGNRDFWFCDNGQAKGFVEAASLTPHTVSGSEEPLETSERPVAVVAPYDEVAEDSFKKPTRRAPPVPGQSRLIGVSQTPSHVTRAERGDKASVHSYEEICASEASEVELGAAGWCGLSLDLSPVYEEIPGGGSRSSLSSSAGSRSSRSSGRSASPRGKFYFALYEFVPEDNDGSMMGVSRGQVVRVIAASGVGGAGDWWYVEDRHAARGYVPASYLKPYYESH